MQRLGRQSAEFCKMNGRGEQKEPIIEDQGSRVLVGNVTLS